MQSVLGMKNQQQEEEKPAKRAAADKPVDRETEICCSWGPGPGLGQPLLMTPSTFKRSTQNDDDD